MIDPARTTDPAGPAEAPESRLERLLARWPTSRRRRIATAVAMVAILVATIVASSRLLRLVFQEVDLLAYAGLVAACWIGAGGALVPVPGVRPISWFMIVQQGAALDPVVVALIAAGAMALGQTSYFLAARAARRRRAAGRPEPALDLQQDPDAPPDGAPPSAPSRRAERMERARVRVTRQVHEHGMATVFAVCALPTPLTTLTTTAAAATGMGYARYLPAAFGGYLVLSSVLVLFGQGLMLAIRTVVPLG